MITYCSCNIHKGAYPICHSRDKVLFKSTKFRLLNELDCLEETIVRRQKEICELEEVLEKHKTHLTAVQMEVLFSFLTCTIISF